MRRRFGQIAGVLERPRRPLPVPPPLKRGRGDGAAPSVDGPLSRESGGGIGRGPFHPPAFTGSDKFPPSGGSGERRSVPPPNGRRVFLDKFPAAEDARLAPARPAGCSEHGDAVGCMTAPDRCRRIHRRGGAPVKDQIPICHDRGRGASKSGRRGRRCAGQAVPTPNCTPPANPCVHTIVLHAPAVADSS